MKYKISFILSQKKCYILLLFKFYSEYKEGAQSLFCAKHAFMKVIYIC